MGKNRLDLSEILGSGPNYGDALEAVLAARQEVETATANLEAIPDDDFGLKAQMRLTLANSLQITQLQEIVITLAQRLDRLERPVDRN